MQLRKDSGVGSERRGKNVTTFKLVLPEHLNHYGFLFGGNLLKWVDEASWIAASTEFPGCRFVTIGMDRVEFRKGAGSGAILKLEVDRERTGRTSVTYRVKVYRQDVERMEHAQPECMFATRVTLVRIGSRGQKQPLPSSAGPEEREG